MSIRNNDQGHGRPHSVNERPTRQRATDREIQKWISRQHGFVPETAWIAHCKELFGLAARSMNALQCDLQVHWKLNVSDGDSSGNPNNSQQTASWDSNFGLQPGDRTLDE